MLKKALFGTALASAVLGAFSCEPTNQGYMPDQPINYSHAVHAGAMQIPCQYCHYQASRGPHAGIPEAQICMNCHKQVVPEHPEVKKVTQALETGEPIAWVRVHRLPDHVYFNHSAHVTKGVDCAACHGDVRSMGRVKQAETLTMGFCLDCHRGDPESEDYAPGGPLTECAVCHH